MKIPIYQVDAFTSNLFGGNPAAVCPLTEWIDPGLMQNIAAENNLSETAFFVKKNDLYELRWFTPEIEVDLCGHATLATGHVLFNHLGYAEKEIRFETKSGRLTVTRSDDFISLDFPARPPEKADPPDRLIEGLGKKPLEVYKSRDYLALFETEKEVLSIQPDFKILEKLDALGIIITTRGDTSDFVSRFFAPGAGINEDPVTGSAHTTLVPFWANRLNKTQFHAFQISKRGGELFCQLVGDRVLISGKAKTYLTGEIEI
ncbi:MAG: PhzF family phenazine biosynthesis protein [Bacteroidales bacterium]|nr:PhzF family phenazine biosynthesis protein [Bacteroidales bacterium]